MRKRLLGVAGLVTGLLLLGPLPVQAAESVYRLGYGDAVTVTVVGQPGLTIADQPVRPDGRVSLPLVQEVLIQGKTVAEVTAALTKAYQPFLAEPQIVVSVAKFRACHITLLGQINRPGTTGFESAPTLVEAIASAGGLSERARRDAIKLIVPGQPPAYYDLDRVLSGEVPNPRVGEGAVIEVCEVWGPDWYRVLPLAASILTAGALLLR